VHILEPAKREVTSAGFVIVERTTRLPRARSVPEGDVFELWRRAVLPEPVRNVTIQDASGAHVGTPDGWIDEVAFAWEADSVEFHHDVEGYARTMARTTATRPPGSCWSRPFRRDGTRKA
jgi:hypothetical protein